MAENDRYHVMLDPSVVDAAKAVWPDLSISQIARKVMRERLSQITLPPELSALNGTPMATIELFKQAGLPIGKSLRDHLRLTPESYYLREAFKKMAEEQPAEREANKAAAIDKMRAEFAAREADTAAKMAEIDAGWPEILAEQGDVAQTVVDDIHAKAEEMRANPAFMEMAEQIMAHTNEYLGAAQKPLPRKPGFRTPAALRADGERE